MAIGLYRGSMIKPCSTPIPPAHLISPAGVQRAAAPCLHAALRHSRASASLVPATLAHPNKVIGLYQGSEDQTLQYQEHILDLTFSPVNPAHLISPAGVQGAAAPCLHTALKHSQGQRSACPCRCGAPQQGDRDCIGDRRSNPAVPRSPLPTWYRLRGFRGRHPPVCIHL